MLIEFDDRAYDEALKSGGLLHYFKGDLGPNRECLSFCLWQSREHAVAAMHLPRHLDAISIAKDTYESFSLERKYLVKNNGVVETIPVE